MSEKTPTPPWLIQAATVLVGLLLTFHLVYDALNSGYDGYQITFGLLGAFMLLLGVKNSQGGDK